MPEDAAFQEAVNALLDRTIRLPTRRDYPYCEPSDLEGIRAHRPDGPRTLPGGLAASSKASRIAGAWLGRCVGCLLGKPIEDWEPVPQQLFRATDFEFVNLGNDEFVDAVLRIDMHDVAQDRHSADFHHRFRFQNRFLGKPCAQSAC